MAERKTPVPRKSFSKLPNILEVPNLIAVQTESFEWFKKKGLREILDDISPIVDYTGNYEVRFGDYEFRESTVSLKECRDKDQTYSLPLFIKVGFVNLESGVIIENDVFMGEFPMMTEQGTFIINGTERVIVTQLVRSPGAYVMSAKDPTKQVLVANLMPARGSWLEFEIDKRANVSVRIDRKRKLPVTVFLRALAGIDSEATKDKKGLLSVGSDEEILAL
ncbi:MAG TPA: DNA-directed RNA polymerase subunit beta, partial [Anaerolineae bacterium]|nr:DNA-directed RNA polymerase subunit beta [Anaerolineae bacterium]